MDKIPELSNALFDLMASEALAKYVIGEAKIPAITINSTYLRAPDAKKNEPFTVYFGGNIAHYNARTFKDARKIAEGILETTKKPIDVTVFDEDGNVSKFLHFNPKTVRANDGKVKNNKET